MKILVEFGRKLTMGQIYFGGLFFNVLRYLGNCKFQKFQTYTKNLIDETIRIFRPKQESNNKVNSRPWRL